MRMFICFLFVALAYVGPSALAGQQTPQPTSSSLFPIQGRIGVGGALEYMTAEASLKIKPSGSLGNISSNQNHIGKKLQFAPCLEFGMTIGNDYYLGLHVSWRHSGATNTSRSPISSRPLYHFLHRFRVNSYFDVLAKPGYKLTPQIMVYGLIGPSVANWSHTTEQFLVNGATDVTTLIDQHKTTRNSIGLGIVAGVEYLIKYK